jgi:hypothetical protein
MKRLRFPFSIRTLINSLLAILLVIAATIPMWLIGRDTLGEAVIGLLYLLPVAWSAPLEAASISAAGCLPGLNFLLAVLHFISQSNSWCFIFIGSIVVCRSTSVVGRVALCMNYVLSSSVCTPEAVIYTLANIQQLYEASLAGFVQGQRFRCQ